MYANEELSLTALGLFESRVAPVTCRLMFELARIATERKARLRDDATISYEILIDEYHFSEEAAERAGRVTQLVPGITHGTTGTSTWWGWQIGRGALLLYRNVESQSDLWSVLQQTALEQMGTKETMLAAAPQFAPFPAYSLLEDHAPGSMEEDSGGEIWRPDQYRLFVSHLAAQKAFAQSVCDDLRNLNIDGFVAHTSIRPSREWALEITRALDTCDAFVGLMHKGFSRSVYTHQEVGWAMARRIPLLMVNLGENPAGFSSRFQADFAKGSSPGATATTILRWLSEQDRIGPLILDRLITSLRNAPSFVLARDCAERIAAIISDPSDELLDRITDAAKANNQIYPNHVAMPIVRDLLQRHDRTI
jgi:hypothetical protein